MSLDLKCDYYTGKSICNESAVEEGISEADIDGDEVDSEVGSDVLMIVQDKCAIY